MKERDTGYLFRIDEDYKFLYGEVKGREVRLGDADLKEDVRDEVPERKEGM